MLCLGGARSIRGSYLVTMEWNEIKIIPNHWHLLEKGVCFDTGGYKPQDLWKT